MFIKQRQLITQITQSFDIYYSFLLKTEYENFCKIS